MLLRQKPAEWIDEFIELRGVIALSDLLELQERGLLLLFRLLLLRRHRPLRLTRATGARAAVVVVHTWHAPGRVFKGERGWGCAARCVIRYRSATNPLLIRCPFGTGAQDVQAAGRLRVDGPGVAHHNRMKPASPLPPTMYPRVQTLRSVPHIR